MYHLGTIKVEHMLLECGRRIFLYIFFWYGGKIWMSFLLWKRIIMPNLQEPRQKSLLWKKAACCDLVSALMRDFFFTEQVVLCGLYTSPDGVSHVERVQGQNLQIQIMPCEKCRPKNTKNVISDASCYLILGCFDLLSLELI